MRRTGVKWKPKMAADMQSSIEISWRNWCVSWLICLKIGSDGWGVYGIFLLYKHGWARVSKKDLKSVLQTFGNWLPWIAKECSDGGFLDFSVYGLLMRSWAVECLFAYHFSQCFLSLWLFGSRQILGALEQSEKCHRCLRAASFFPACIIYLAFPILSSCDSVAHDT